MFEQLRQAYLSGDLHPHSNQVVADRLSEFPESKITPYESFSDAAKAAGLKLLQKSQWARLILNGGMATRFGGKVKGICEVYDGMTFLELKIAHINKVEKALGIPEIPLALMNSPATNEATCAFLKQKNYFGRHKL